jgi:redox-sensitive bicupin YhaK (pirin superfamily)
VTYLLSGRNEHRDSAGHTGVVSQGGAQWMTSGRGIIHAERPLAENEAELTMHGIQLWTSLPRALKSMEPRYQRIAAESIPAAAVEGASVRVIAGEFAGREGPASTLMPLLLWHVTIERARAFEAAIPAGFEVAAYVIEGDARIGEARATTGNLAVFAGTEGAVRIENAGAGKLEVMILGGTPAEGPLVFHGPFVMNSVEQVRAAEVAYRTGRMGALGD